MTAPSRIATDTDTTGGTNATTLACDLQTTIAAAAQVGDKVVTFCGCDGAATQSVSAGAGWSKIDQHTGSGVNLALYEFDVAVAATVPDLTIAFGANQMAYVRHILIRPASGTFAAGIIAKVDGDSTNPDPPALTNSTGSSQDLLVIAAASADANGTGANTPMTGGPSAYSNIGRDNVGNTQGVTLSVADLAVTVANTASEDPSAWTHVTEQWAAMTVGYYSTGGGGSQSLTASFETNSQTFFSAVLSLALVASLLTNTQSFYAPTIAHADATLTVPLHTNSQTDFGPTLTPGAVAITAPLTTNSQAFYSPTITPGAVTATLPLHSNSQSFYGPTVAPGAVTVTLPLLTNSQTFYDSEISQGLSLDVPLHTNSQVFYGPQLNLGLVMGGVTAAVVTVMFIRGVTSQRVQQAVAPPEDLALVAGLFTETQTFYSATVVPDGLVTVPLHTNTQTFYAPIVGAAPFIALPLHTNTQSTFAPQINLHLVASRLTNSQTFYSPTLLTSTGIAAPLHTNSQSFYAPQINLRLVAPLTTNSQTFYAPTVTTGTTLITPLHSNSQSFYGPQVNQQIRPPLFTNTTAFRTALISNGPTPGIILSQPSLSVTSGDGEELEVDIGMGADIYAGIYLRIQRSLDGVKNVSDGSYASATLNLEHLVTGSEEQALAVTNADLAPDGYFSASGDHYQQYRWEREDGAISDWSTEVHANVTDPVATWHVINGANKNKSCTVDGLSWTCANQGATHGVRSTVAKSGKGHVEYTIDGISASGAVRVGVVDGTFAIGPDAFPTPGSSLSSVPVPGCTFSLTASGSWSCFRNGSQATGTLGFTPVAGDVIIAEFDTATNVIKFYFHDTSAGTDTLVTTQTLASPRIPAAWHGYAGGLRNNDAGTANFGKSAFAMTPTTGYAGW